MPVYEERTSHEVTLKDSGLIEVRRTVQVYKDGQAFGAPSHHRTVATPDSDLTRLPIVAGKVGEEALDTLPAETIEAVHVFQTPERKARYAAAMQALRDRELAAQAPAREKSLLNTLTFGVLGG